MVGKLTATGTNVPLRLLTGESDEGLALESRAVGIAGNRNHYPLVTEKNKIRLGSKLDKGQFN